MSGIFINGKWYENTGMICRRCGKPVYESDNPEYTYQCFMCDEDLYSFEATEQDAQHLPKVLVARPIDGITINEDLEYLLDETGKAAQVFNNQPDAEAWLTALGYSPEDLERLYFVEYNDEPLKGREGGCQPCL